MHPEIQSSSSKTQNAQTDTVLHHRTIQKPQYVTLYPLISTLVCPLPLFIVHTLWSNDPVTHPYTTNDAPSPEKITKPP